MNYCTVADVLEIAKIYQADYTDNTLDPTRVTEAIVEATNIVRTVLKPRFSFAVVEALSPLPPTIIKLTAIKAALILTNRLGQMQLTPEAMKSLDKDNALWVSMIANGTIIQDDGTILQGSFPPASIVQSTNSVSEVYANGRRRY